MDSLKRIFKSAMDDRSPRFMLGTIALGVVVALLAGTLIGYKLDNGNSSATPKKAKAAAVKKKKPKRRNNHAVAAPLLLGSVVSARPAKIVVVGANKKRVPLVIGGRTRAETATPASAASITVGSKVLWAPTATGSTNAAEVVVLPSSAGLGSPVTAVSPGTSMTIGGVVVRTQGASVLRATPSNRRKIPNGSKVAVVYFILRGKSGAVEVVILPASSKL
jgi:hypothetical protein